jgi:hypothetical protein
MISNLQKARQGMVDLGLTPETYGAFWPWDMTPDNRMDWEYAHIDQTIERAKDVAKWRDGQNSQGTQATDVYEQKMDNLRSFLVEGGWSDDIAYSAWMVKDHLVIYNYSLVVAGELLVGAIMWAWASKPLWWD